MLLNNKQKSRESEREEIEVSEFLSHENKKRITFPKSPLARTGNKS